MNKRARLFLLPLFLLAALLLGTACGALPATSQSSAPPPASSISTEVADSSATTEDPSLVADASVPTDVSPALSTPIDPKPEAPPSQESHAENQSAAPVCTLSITCATVLDHPKDLNAEKNELIPADGWILKTVSVSYTEGDTVFDVLQRACRENGIHMEYTDTPAYHSAYLEGIGNLYEFDCGSLSGWVYRVNGNFPNYGCSSYTLQSGDTVEWLYTCDLGNDVGGGAEQLVN